jgi:uncharacterized membrane protein
VDVHLRLSALAERIRASLFFLPMLGVVVAVAAAAAALALDRHLGQTPGSLPLGLVSTVDGARSLLSTVAGATISFAGIAFSISLLVIQQASSQYSPRVVHALFRDPFNKRVMGLVVGTFTYCLIVLRSVRAPLDQGGDPVIPNASIAIAVVLGISTILAVVAFIDHSAHSMDVSEVLERVRIETTDNVRQTWRTPEPAGTAGVAVPAGLGGGPEAEIRFTRTGWIQQIDFDGLVGAIDHGSTLRLATAPGRYAIAGTVVAMVHPVPEDLDQVAEAVNEAIATGATRTMQQDATYGLRQLVDVALKALSPGVNDPTTAQDAIFHAAAVLAEMLQRDPPQPVCTVEGDRSLIAEQQPTPEELVQLAFEELRRSAASHPMVCTYLLEALALVSESLAASEVPDRSVFVEAQAALLLDGCRAADLISSDLEMVEEAYRRRF